MRASLIAALSTEDGRFLSALKDLGYPVACILFCGILELLVIRSRNLNPQNVYRTHQKGTSRFAPNKRSRHRRVCE
jgi:hypothetical protein